MVIKTITIIDIEFKKGVVTLTHEPNKMWDDDIIETSSEISWTVVDDTLDRCRCFVKADNKDEAIQEILPRICYNELLGEDLSFSDIGLPDVKYETYDDGDGYITSINDFNNLLNADIHLVDRDLVLRELYDKSVELFNVVVEQD